MRHLTALATIGLCLVLLVRSAGAACDAIGADAVDVETARDAIAASCDCDGAPSPAVYRRCGNTQQWSLAPLNMTPGCPFCTKTWTGTATSFAVP